MRGFFTVFLIAAVTFSCKENREKRQLSLVLLSNDSAAIYNGPLNKYGSVEMIRVNENALSNIIDEKIAAYGMGLEVIVKPTTAMGGEGNVADILLMINELLLSKNISFSTSTTLTEAETKYFDAEGIKEIIDRNLDPNSMKLFMPKHADPDFVADTVVNENYLNIWMIDQLCIFSFKGNDKESGKLYCDYSNAVFKKIIADYESTNDGQNINIVLKPFENSSFETMVAMLDRMTSYEIKRYSLSDVTPSEQSFADSLINSLKNNSKN